MRVGICGVVDDRGRIERDETAAEGNRQLLFPNGLEVTQDPAEALRWSRAAAEQGHAEAQANTGLIYARGEGVPVDMKTAYMWFRLAADHGDEDALQAIQAVTPTLTKQEIEAAEAAADNWRAQP